MIITAPLADASTIPVVATDKLAASDTVVTAAKPHTLAPPTATVCSARSDILTQTTARLTAASVSTSASSVSEACTDESTDEAARQPATIRPTIAAAASAN